MTGATYNRRMRTLSCGLLLLCGLVACQTPAPLPVSSSATAGDIAATYAALAASGGTRYRVDAQASSVRIYAFRAGAAKKAGHNHVLSAPRFEGEVYLPGDDPTQARFDLSVPLASLVVDDPTIRSETGGNFASERSASDIEGTRRNLLGAKGLDAEQFPRVQIRSLAVAGDWPVLVVEVAVTLHGVTRNQSLVMQVQHSSTALTASGALVLRQSDFGLTPFSVLGGLLAVQDAVAIRFELHASPVAR